MSKRYSIIRGNYVEYSLWLIFDETGGVRTTRAVPSLARSERAMALTLTIPRAIFRTPQLAAKITIEDSEAKMPTIDITAAETALRQAIGCDVQISVREEPGQ